MARRGGRREGILVNSTNFARTMGNLIFTCPGLNIQQLVRSCPSRDLEAEEEVRPSY